MGEGDLLTIDQLIISGLFLWLMACLVFTDWSVPYLFTCTMLIAYFLGLVDTAEMLGKATNSGLVTLMLLLLVSVGLEKLYWLNRLSGKLITSSYAMSVLRLGFVTAFFSALVNNTAVVATLAHTVRSNRHHPASRLLLPLSYAAILGGTMTLIGTSTNMIVSSMLEDVTGQGLAFFDFFFIGATVTVLGMLVILLSSFLLPSGTAERLDVHQYLIETEVQLNSPLIGKSIAENHLRDLDDLFLVELVRDDYLVSPVSPSEHIEAGDKLIFSGDIKKLNLLEDFPGLQLFAVEEGLLRENMTEVIVLPNATIEGRTIKESGFRSLFDAAVVGMRRGGKRLSGKLGSITLQAGDSMILAVGPDFGERKNLGKNFVIVDDSVAGAKISAFQNYFVTITLCAVIALASLELVPLIKGLLFLLACMLIFGVVKGSELRRRFPFELWLIIASALILAQALKNSGLVALTAASFSTELAAVGPYVALVGIYFFTLFITEVMTNNAAAALSFPLAYGLAESFGVNMMPFVMAVAYGASASFLTPYGYTTNLMVQNLGGYSMGNYFRFGLPLSVAYSGLVLFLIPRVFPF